MVLAVFKKADFGPSAPGGAVVVCSKAIARQSLGRPAEVPAPFVVDGVPGDGEFFFVGLVLTGGDPVPFGVTYVRVDGQGRVYDELGEGVQSVGVGVAGYAKVDCSS